MKRKKAPADEQATGPDFEKSLRELEALVDRMERGDLPLDEALRLFERGVGLTRDCQKALQSAQARVQQLTVRDGESLLQDFEETDEHDESSPGRGD